MICSGCGSPILRSDPAYREISGWEKVRSQGGTNAVLLRKELGRVLCATCFTALRYGNKGESLF